MFKKINISAMIGAFIIVHCVLLTCGCDDQSTAREKEIIQDMDHSLSAGNQSGEESDMEEVEGGQSNTVALSIPMMPKLTSTEQLIFTPQDIKIDNDETKTYFMKYVLKMTEYEGYSNRLERLFNTPIIVDCMPSTGTFELQQVMGDGLNIELIETNSIIIENWPLGTSTATVFGIYHPSSEDLITCEGTFDPNIPTLFEIVYEISAEIPTQLTSSPPSAKCNNTAEGLLMANSTLENIVGVQLLNDEGERVGTQNATYSHPVPLEVFAPLGTTLRTPEQGLSGIHLGALGGPLSISAPFGSPIEYTVIETQEITDWSIVWSIAGVAGGGIPILDNDAVYDGPWNRTSNRILPVMTGHFVRGNDSICTSNIESTWFRISSDTPNTCVVDEVASTSQEVGGKPIGHSVKLIADGECNLTLTGPLFNGEQGLIDTLSITVNNVDQMIDL